MKIWVSLYLPLVIIITCLLVGCTSATYPGSSPSAQASTAIPGGETAIPATGRIKIRWFIGVDTGKTEDALSTARQFVEDFNTSQDKIELVMEVVTSSTHAAIDQLMAEIDAGDPPDIVAPADMGWAGEQLTGRILPVDATLYDLSDVNSKVLESWIVEGKLMGFPAGAFTSVIFYNKHLFDLANLPYPPHHFGESYADGEEWTIEKMEAIALKLTRDVNGQDATAANFDPHHIAQWGFHWQWDSTRSMAVMFGAGSVVDANGNAVIPEQWREAFNWYYDGIWQKHFIPTNAQSMALQGNPFKSGKIAMVHSFMWYAPRLLGDTNWDIAAVPAYKGKITTRMQRDGVFVLNTTQYPVEAFEVAYAIATSPELLLAWEMLPSSMSMQSSFIEALQAKQPGVDWQVMLDSMEYADTTYEDGMPNHRQAYDRLLAFRDLLSSYADLDLEAEMDKLEADLQALFDAGP